MDEKAIEAVELLVRAAQAARLTYREHASCDAAATYLRSYLKGENLKPMVIPTEGCKGQS